MLINLKIFHGSDIMALEIDLVSNRVTQSLSKLDIMALEIDILALASNRVTQN